MTFSDDDLKRLKNEVIRCETSGSSLPLGEMMADVSPAELKALIARLEAAEKAINAWEAFSLEIHSRVRGVKDEFELRMVKANAMEAWRKAAGK